MKFLSTAALLKSPVCLTIEVTPSRETRIRVASVNWPANQIPRISCLAALNFYKTFAFPFLGVPFYCKTSTHSYNKYVFLMLCSFFRLSLQQVTRKAICGSNQHNEWTFSKKIAVLADLWKAKLAITWADASLEVWCLLSFAAQSKWPWRVMPSSLKDMKGHVCVSLKWPEESGRSLIVSLATWSMKYAQLRRWQKLCWKKREN